MLDVVVVGAGPAGAALVAALADAGLQVAGITPMPPDTPWTNTYGIWADDLDRLGLADLLAHRWYDCTVYAGSREIALGRDYGLFDNARLQAHLLGRAAAGGAVWQSGKVTGLAQDRHAACVTIQGGGEFSARVVVDASGHFPALVRRPPGPPVAYQAAYGIMGRFSLPPVRPGQMVLMDYRTDYQTEHRGPEEPPTFLYAMDLGEGRYFVEETSLAHAPALRFDLLAQRLQHRLAQRGIQVEEVEQVERCLFPMNLPLPERTQPVAGFGGAASMVHPASGYLVGSVLSRAPELAAALAAALADHATPAQAAAAGWQALWPRPRLQRRSLYLFGLAGLLRLSPAQTQGFFTAFFELPRPLWTGYLSDMLTTPQLLWAMLALFGRAPNSVRRELAATAGTEAGLLWRALAG